MAPDHKPVLGYVILYVKDVAESVAFYTKAFGYAVRRLDESHRLIITLHLLFLHSNEITNLRKLF